MRVTRRPTTADAAARRQPCHPQILGFLHGRLQQHLGGISIPCGHADVDGAKLPIGLQIQCKAFDEATMFRIARLYERTTDA